MEEEQLMGEGASKVGAGEMFQEAGAAAIVVVEEGAWMCLELPSWQERSTISR